MDPQDGIKQDRSPKYPVFDLKTAVDKARVLYDSAKRSAIKTPVAAKLWGYSEKSSAGMQAIGAAIGYGLLDVEGRGDDRRVSLSKLAMDILHQPSDSQKYRDAIKTAALNPTIFRRIWDHHNGDLPPNDDAITPDLITEYGFTDKAAKHLVGEFRDTISFAGLDSGTPTVDNENGPKDGRKDETGSIRVGDFVQWTSLGVAQFVKPRKVVEIGEQDGEKFACVVDEAGEKGWAPMNQVTLENPISEVPGRESPPRLKPPSPDQNSPNRPGMKSETFALDDGEVVIRWPAKLTTHEFEDIEQWMDILKRKIKRGIQEGN